MKKLLIISLLIIAAFTKASAQQDAQFSQYMFNGIYINPAYAGYREVLNANAFFRKQWVKFPGSPQTVSFAIDGIANKKRVGLALQVINDQIGVTANTAVYGNYAYRLQLDRRGTKTLAMGLGIGFKQSTIDVARLDPNTPGDPTILSASRSIFMPDARCGVFFSTKRFYAGASVDNLITNSYTVQKTFMLYKIHYYITAGGLFTLSDHVDYKPSFLIKDDIAGPTSLDLNNFFLLNDRLWLGVSYRTAVSLYDKPRLQDGLSKQADIVGMIDYFLNKKIRLGVAYDYSINKVSQRYPTYEFSLGYYFVPRSRSMTNPRYNSRPF